MQVQICIKGIPGRRPNYGEKALHVTANVTESIGNVTHACKSSEGKGNTNILEPPYLAIPTSLHPTCEVLDWKSDHRIAHISPIRNKGNRICLGGCFTNQILE